MGKRGLPKKAAAPPACRLLGRQEFFEAVSGRCGGICCVCRSRPCEEAHHIYERKLWPDGGYYLSNGAGVCGPCHWLCEGGRVSPQALREAMGLAGMEPQAPPGWRKEGMDKWGNWRDGQGILRPGPLGMDEGMVKALARSGGEAPVPFDL